MRNLIMIAVILHLVIIEASDDSYEFGDIIAFETTCPCIGTILYKHYAVYVGGNVIPYLGNNKIFHRTGLLGSCHFDVLEGGIRDHTKDNYLETLDPHTYQKGTNEEIATRILAKVGRCGVFSPFGNNCETLSNWVRYGVELTLQHDTLVEGLVSGIGKRRKRDVKLKEYLKRMKENAELEEQCLICKNILTT